MGKTSEYQLKDARVLLTELDEGYRLQIVKQQFFHGNALENFLLAIPVAIILGLLPAAAITEWGNIFATTLTAAISYTVAFFGVKSFIRKKRADTEDKLLHITEVAENRLRKLAGNTETGSGRIQIAQREESAPEDNITQKNKLRS
ncbi:hypothetical protein ACG2F4_04640 [Halalkalibaculum sp. DA3122]|uniref:hypothetical protein n=1 Tax=Halalkalibaculum sp. DA3122 TaxID=3373607 RepID=UPI0037540DCC